MMSNDTYFSDSLFSGVKTDQETMAKEVYYCRPIKTMHKGFCPDTLENLTKGCLGELYLVLNITPRIPSDRPIMDIVYKYNS